jgi:phytoene synthase
LVAEARRHDPDRYLCALLAPARAREPILALLLLDHELARVPDLVSQPIAGLIRYQWWRDAVAEAAEGSPRDHPVVEALGAALASGALGAGELTDLIDARERELDALAPEDLPALETYLDRTAGAVQALTLRSLGGGTGSQAAAARLAGRAFGMVRVVLAVHAGAARRFLPDETLREAGVEAASTTRARGTEALARAVERLVTRAEATVAEARDLAGRPPRTLMAAFLPARLAAAYAGRIRRAGFDPFAPAALERPPLAVLDLLRAALTRRF